MRKTVQHLSYAGLHVLANIDGKKRPPKWLHRAHKLGHLIYFGTIAFGFAAVHDNVVMILFALEGLTLVLGQDQFRDMLLEYE